LIELKIGKPVRLLIYRELLHQFCFLYIFELELRTERIDRETDG